MRQSGSGAGRQLSLHEIRDRLKVWVDEKFGLHPGTPHTMICVPHKTRGAAPGRAAFLFAARLAGMVLPKIAIS
jgi:hypothetical protein